MPLIGGYNDLWGISMKRKLLVILTVVLLLCGCGTNVRPPQEEEQCTINEDLRIRTLAEVWCSAKNYYGYWESLSEMINWDAAFDQFLPRVREVKNDDEYVDLMREFTALLHDGHTQYIPFQGYVSNKGSLPIQLEYLDGTIYLIGKNDKVDVELGSQLVSVNHEPALDYILSNYSKFVPVLTEPAHTRETLEQFKSDKIGKKITLQFKAEDNSMQEIQLEYSQQNNAIIEELSVKTSFDNILYNSQTYTVAPINDDILYIEIRSFSSGGMDNTFTNMILPQLENYRGCILDVRQNRGGNSYHGDVILQSLSAEGVPSNFSFSSVFISSMVPYASDNVAFQTDDLTKSAAQKMMKHAYYGTEEELSEYVLSQADNWHTIDVPKVLTMPVVVLTSDQTGSAADTFAAKAKVIKNFTVMGLTTHGATGNNHEVELPDGSFYTLSVDNAYSPEGYCIWNHGAIPDIEVWQTLEDLKNREDTVLNAAIETLAETLHRE
ncbi:hypothetical protein GKD93_10140 [Holdemania massiliensis]|uniref:Tail specific protease domain-containing protein n=2 Tax=Holdemania massiliensis TaxID=1468449 RepID=A0A6N7S770_9FIRM|nr:hypothetical protein [Holdemania massiliensis]MSA89723.1 hypothetical protein [Holdemania massiliensis]MSB78554.1 hypothetical protein [Holdemania massiliensis]MSC33478.1 hypothetical protein [Holdemania massiliensis]MSC39869.1 hypothetical protein [Holdemania massiliensis]